MRWVFLFALIFTASLCADVPWISNVRVSTNDPWDNLNQGESCFDIYGDSIFSICNTAERGSVPIAPYAYSFDEGQTFSQIPFTDNTTGIIWHTDPVIAVDDSGHVHMLIQFSTDLLKHYLSRDGGLSWSDTTIVTPYYGVDKDWMVVNKNEIYVVWQQVSGEIGIWFAKSIDYGASFNAYRIWDRLYITALCMDENENLHLALVDYTTGDSIYYRKSIDKGETWLPEVSLSDWYYVDSYGDRAPINSITARGDVVFVTWVDTRYGGWDIMGVRSTDGGTTWESPFVVNDITNGGQCKGWAHFDDYGGLHVIYYHTPDWPTNQNSKFSFHYQYSPDSGATFNPSVRVSDTSFTSQADFMGEYHICVSDSQYLYAIWTDGRNGDDNDLYFSKALISELSGNVPIITIYDYECIDSEGDSIANPGDTLSLFISLINYGNDASNVDVKISTNDSFLFIIDSISNYGGILEDSIKTNSNDPFIFYFDESTSAHICTLNVDIDADGKYSSELITITLGIPPVLLIDDDGGGLYEKYFSQSLNRIGLLFDIRDAESGISGSFLSNYQSVIWFTGNNSQPLDSMNVVALTNYLDSGGNLFISGQDVEGCYDSSFYHNYLHAILLEDSTYALAVAGVSADPISDGLFFLIRGAPGADNQLTPSIISPIGGADSIFNHNLGGCCGVKYSESYKVVYLSFGYEAIASLSSADTVMARILNWFGVSAGIEEEKTEEKIFFISQCYTNPFNERTHIEYNLPGISNVNISVYNVLGSKVKELLNKRQNTGRYTITWDGNDERGNKLPSGFYFLRIEAGGYEGTRKLLLIK